MWQTSHDVMVCEMLCSAVCHQHHGVQSATKVCKEDRDSVLSCGSAENACGRSGSLLRLYSTLCSSQMTWDFFLTRITFGPDTQVKSVTNEKRLLSLLLRSRSNRDTRSGGILAHKFSD